jgi:uncharacterized protein YgiM (DUF1202 family)
MEDSPPRFRFVSLTFLLGFGFGSFVGVALALLAIALVSRNSEPTTTVVAAEEVVIPTVANGVPATPTPDLRPRTKSQLDVRLGPGLAFAIIGTIDRGEALQVTGRDFNSRWVSIQFPPGSTGRGWVPIDELDGLEDLESFAVAIPTPLARTLSNPAAGAASANSGSGSAANNVRPLNPAPQARIPTPPSAEEEAPTPNATATSFAFGPTDLVVTRISLTADRHVSVTIGNRGPGNLVGQSIFVLVRDLAVRSEQIVSPNTNLSVGGTLTLTTQYLQLDSETDIQASVDPSTSLRDPDRSNNVMTSTLRPPATRTPGPQRED